VRAARSLSVALAVVALGLAACGDDGGSDPEVATDRTLEADIALVGDADEGIDGVQAFRIGSNEHVNVDVIYPINPAPGGPHHQVWANCGFYDTPIAEEHVVHDLEHGAVWLAYAPDLSEDDVAAIRALVRAQPKLIATPFDGLAAGEAVVASAWARQLRLDSVADPRLVQFIDRYVDSRLAPEPGVTCTGTPVGDPLD